MQLQKQVELLRGLIYQNVLLFLKSTSHSAITNIKQNTVYLSLLVINFHLHGFYLMAEISNKALNVVMVERLSSVIP